MIVFGGIYFGKTDRSFGNMIKVICSIIAILDVVRTSNESLKVCLVIFLSLWRAKWANRGVNLEHLRKQRKANIYHVLLSFVKKLKGLKLINNQEISFFLD